MPELIAISRETFADTFGKDNSPEDMAKFLDENYNEDKLGEKWQLRAASFTS